MFETILFQVIFETTTLIDNKRKQRIKLPNLCNAYTDKTSKNYVQKLVLKLIANRKQCPIKKVSKDFNYK